jgi:hypothetical protein
MTKISQALTTATNQQLVSWKASLTDLSELTTTTKAINVLTTSKIETARIEYERLSNELQSLRIFYKAMLMMTLPNKEQIMTNIQALAESIKQAQATVNTPTLAELKRTNENAVSTQLRVLIGWVRVQLNVHSNLSKDQIAMIAADLLETYKGMTLEEIAISFKNGIQGKYGRNEYAIDIQTIHHWITSYNKELKQYRLEQYEKRVNSEKVNTIPRDERFSKEYTLDNYLKEYK